MASGGNMGEHRATLLSRLVHRLIIALYRRKDWRLEGGHPHVPKFVITGAPHTSNWDFVFFIGATQELGIRPSFMGKHSLFKWPMTRFMEDMGGISVDRSRRGSNYVDQIADVFGRSRELALVVAPEGSRTSDGEWRSGFWHIARAAGVPIVPAWVDHDNMCGGLGEPIWPSEDMAADFAKLAAFYRAKRPDCDRFVRFAEQAKRMAADD